MAISPKKMNLLTPAQKGQMRAQLRHSQGAALARQRSNEIELGLTEGTGKSESKSCNCAHTALSLLQKSLNGAKHCTQRET